MRPQGDEGDRASSTDARYFVLVGVLLVTILAALAWLWLAERARRVDAEEALMDLRRQRAVSLAEVMRMGGAGQPAGGHVRRDDLSPRQVTVDGRLREGFLVSESAGRRMGFRAGDVIIVAETPAPSSRPVLPARH